MNELLSVDSVVHEALERESKHMHKDDSCNSDSESHDVAHRHCAVELQQRTILLRYALAHYVAVVVVLVDTYVTIYTVFHGSGTYNFAD